MTRTVVLWTIAGVSWVGATAQAWEAVPAGRLNEVMIDNFEDGIIHEQQTNPKPDGFGWQQTTYAGEYDWQVDDTFGADGTTTSMKITVQSTVPYFYYLHGGRDKYILQGYDKPVNRMEYWIHLPQDWKRSCHLLDSGDYCFYNFHVGTYERDPSILLGSSSSTETHGWHFYYHLIYDMYDTSWVRVVLGKWPQHRRSGHINPGFNPCRPQGDMFDHWTRVYFTGTQYTEPAGVDYPHDIWFDQWSFYYQRDYVTINPEYGQGEGLPGDSVVYPITVTNTHPTEAREFGFFKSSELFRAADYWSFDVHLYWDADGDGVHDPAEMSEPNSTGMLQPLEKWRGHLVVNIPASGAGSEIGAYVETTVNAWQKTPAYTDLDPHISVERIKVGGVPTDLSPEDGGILRGTPMVGARFITTTVDSLAIDAVAPAAVDDLSVLAVGEHDARLRWTATGDDELDGACYCYEARYNTLAITEANWQDAIELTGEPDGWTAGTVQTWWLPPEFDPNTSYYVALRVSDERCNSSAMSNVVQFTTAGPHPGNVAPTAAAGADVPTGTTPLTVQFSSAGSGDTDGTIVLYVWDFGDGFVSNEPSPVHTYRLVGSHVARLTVFDNAGASDDDQITITTTRGLAGQVMLRNGWVGYAGGWANRIRQNSADSVFFGPYYGSYNAMVGSYAGVNRGLFQFPNMASSLAIPPGSRVSDARIVLYQGTNTLGAPLDLELYELTQPYVPQQATWNSASSGVPWQTPGAIPAGASPYGVVSADRHALTHRSWDVTDWVRNGQDIGVALRIPQETTSGYIYLSIHDEPDEPAKRPTLLATYSVPGDLDTDADVDLVDLNALVTAMNGPVLSAGDPTADLDDDGDCDLRDAAILMGNFTGAP